LLKTNPKLDNQKLYQKLKSERELKECTFVPVLIAKQKSKKDDSIN